MKTKLCLVPRNCSIFLNYLFYLETWDFCVSDILCEDPGTEEHLVQTKELNEIRTKRHL